MATDIASLVGKVLNIALEVDRRIKEMLRFERNLMRLLEHSKKLGEFIAKLNDDKILIPSQCSRDLSNVYEVLCNCDKLCRSLDNQSVVKKLAFTTANWEKLMELEKELHQAVDLLHGILLKAILVNQKHNADEQKKGYDTLLRNVINPDCGVRKGRSEIAVVLKAVSKPIVTIPPNTLTIEWVDKNNPPGSVSEYEVEYDCANQLTVNGTPDKLEWNGKKNRFSLSLCPPKVEIGQRYTVRVRALGKGSQGEWSIETLSEAVVGRPKKPLVPPSLRACSPTEIEVTVTYDEEATGNSRVRQYKVQYAKKYDDKADEWNSGTFEYAEQIQQFSISGLQADSVYLVRVKMINDYGESPPSDEVEVKTEGPIPDPPAEFRISSKRTPDMLKLRWKEPKLYAHTVLNYEVQYQLVKTRKPEEYITISNIAGSQRSIKIRKLKTDTHYYFRIRGVNMNGRGEYTEVIEGETRFSRAFMALAATGAFFATPFAAPAAAAIGAADSVNNKAGAVAAGVGAGIGGVLAGTIGLPIVGTATAVVAYKALSGDFEFNSPQTSDDEDNQIKVRLKYSLRVSHELDY